MRVMYCSYNLESIDSSLYSKEFYLVFATLRGICFSFHRKSSCEPVLLWFWKRRRKKERKQNIFFFFFLSCPCRAQGFELLRYPQDFCFALIVQPHGVQCVLRSSRTCVNCQVSLMHQCFQQTGDTFQTCKSTYLPNPSEFPPVPAHSLQPVSALYGMTRAVCMTFLRSFASLFFLFLFFLFLFVHCDIYTHRYKMFPKQHWKRETTFERCDVAHMGFPKRVDALLNWAELNWSELTRNAQYMGSDWWSENTRIKP